MDGRRAWMIPGDCGGTAACPWSAGSTTSTKQPVLDVVRQRTELNGRTGVVFIHPQPLTAGILQSGALPVRVAKGTRPLPRRRGFVGREGIGK